MSTNPYATPDGVESLPPKKTTVVRSWKLELVFVVVALVLLAAMFLPIQRFVGVRETARRNTCHNNLAQIALALREYEAEHGALPPAHTVDADGKPLHSWRTLILPYLNQKELYAKIDLAKPWDDPANAEAFKTVVQIYHCPSSRTDFSQTTYLAVVAPGGCFLATEGRKLANITDDRNLTLMVMDVAPGDAVPWKSPHDATEQMWLDMPEIASRQHKRYFQAVTVGGMVPILDSENISPSVLKAFLTISGHDNKEASRWNEW